MLLADQTVIDRFDPPGAGATVTVTVATEVFNPNNFPIDLQQVQFSLSLAGRKVFDGRLSPSLLVEANKQERLVFQVSTSLEGKRDLMLAVARAFTGTALTFQLEGSTVFTSQSFEFSSRNSLLTSGEILALQVVREPILRLDETLSGVFLLREDVPVVRLILQVYNPGEIGYFVYGKDVVLLLGNERIAVQDITPIPVPAQQISRFDLLFYPEPAKLSSATQAALAEALAGSNTQFTLEGSLLLDVLGVDTFEVADGWLIRGSLANASP